MMDKIDMAFWLTLIGTLCWVVCFWWMHRISSKQSALLDQLHAQGKRIEKLSSLEHELIKQVHPQVGEIKEGMHTMVAAAKENKEGMDTMVAAAKEHKDGMDTMVAAVKENTENNSAVSENRQAHQ
jgi:methyl-accepting chemotaxis protein